MPRYHFNSVDGHRDDDIEGTVLPDDQSAQAAAVRYAGQVLADDPKLLWEKGQWRVEVTNDDGVMLFTVITLAVDAPRPKVAA